MKHAVVVVLLAACHASADDYPSRPGTGGPTTVGTGNTGADAGVGDGGLSIAGRLCILRDLRHPTDCDSTKDASKLTVMLGSKVPAAPPARSGEFSIAAQLGTGLVWRVSGQAIAPTVMPLGTDATIPVVPDELYRDLLVSNSVILPAEGQGSVVVRVVRGVTPASGVAARSTLTSANAVPLYDADNSAFDWSQIGPTQSSGVVWFPGVDVTTAPARVTLTPPAPGAPVSLTVSVETGAITFVTQDLQ